MPLHNNALKIIQKQEEHLNIANHLNDWYKSHKISPKKIKIDNNEYYLLTDYNGNNDSNYRIIFDPLTSCFGLEMLDDENTSEIILDMQHSLSDVIENM
jgi:hypothetical protein